MDLKCSEIKNLLYAAKEEIEVVVQKHLDILNKSGAKVDMLICQHNVDRINGQIEQLASVNLSVVIE